MMKLELPQLRDGLARRTSRFRFVAVLLAVAVLVVPMRVGPLAAETTGEETASPIPGPDSDLFPQVGDVEVRNADGTRPSSVEVVGIDPPLGRLIMSSSDDSVMLIDTVTLEQTDTIDVDVRPMVKRSVVDTSNHRLITVADNAEVAPQPQGSVPDLTTLDLNSGREETHPLVIDTAPESPPLDIYPVGAPAYHPPTDNLYLLTRSVPGLGGVVAAEFVGNPWVTLHEIDMAAFRDAEAGQPVTPEWSVRVDPCVGVSTAEGKTTTLARSLQHDFVYFACQSEFTATLTAGLRLQGAVRVDLPRDGPPSASDVEFTPFGGDLAQGFAGVAPERDVMFFATSSAGNQKLFVFDVAHLAWTGAVKLFNVNTPGAATNSQTGRVYQFDDDGTPLIVLESSHRQVGSGDRYDIGLEGINPNRAPLVDPATRRIFIEGGFLCLEEDENGDCISKETGSKVAPVRVFEDRTAPEPPPVPADPDDRTEDVDDEEASFIMSGNAQAFGARYTFVRGTGGTRAAKPSSALEQFVEPTVEGAPAGANTRDLFVGQSIGANLSASSFGSPQVGASAAGLVPGDQTVLDLRANSNVQCTVSNLATRANGPLAAIQNADDGENSVGVPDPGCFDDPPDEETDRRTDGLSWPNEFPEQMRGHVSLCRVFSGEPEHGSKPGSAVKCDPSTPLAEAASVFDANEASPFSIGHAESVASVTKDDERGTVATAEAITQAVNVLGVIRIGEIRTTAEAIARGRTGSATTTLQREAHQVAVGPPGEEPAFTCGFGQDPCDLYQVAEAINDRFQPRIRAFVPPQSAIYDVDSDSQSLDGEISNGTDGGAKASVEIDPYQRQSNKIMNMIDQAEVPALTIIAYDDHKEPSRHVLQLGAVALDANYTVSSRPSFDFPSPGFDGGDGGFPSGTDDGDGGLDLPVQQQRAVQVPPFEPLTDVASQTGPGQSVPDPLAAGQQADGGAGEVTVPGGPSGPVSSGTAPSLSTGNAPTDGGNAPAPEVAAPADDGDGGQGPQATADQQQAPGGLTLTQQRISETVPMAALWLLVALPIYLAVRRRGLITTIRR